MLAKESSGNSSASSALEAETNNDIAKLNRDFNAKRGNVEQMLADMVVKVDSKAPPARSA